MAKAKPVRPPRADAARNRERLLASALKLFTSSKREVTLSAVAAHAGVGIGTLYRHFPTRDALVEALYRHEVERLTEDAAKLLQKMPPGPALEEWLWLYAALVVTKRGLKDALQSIFEPGAETYAYSRDRMTEAATLLVDAASKAGAIREGIDPQDVLLAVAASTWSFAGEKDWKARAGRVLRIVMDGLRYRGG